MKKITIIGAGNMGGAIAKALLKGTLVNASDITISDISEKVLNDFKSISSEIHLTNSNKDAVADADIIIIAVKPWLMENVANELENYVQSDKQLIISIAAGKDFEELRHFFGHTVPLIRIIPNIAIEVKESVSILAVDKVGYEQLKFIRDMFDELGKTFVVPENQLNAFMSLSSCGIAYAFRYIRAAMEGGVEMGIYPEVAKQVVMQTLKGAVALLDANNSHPEIEVDKVTTPGGITIKGLNEMEANGFTNAVIKGLLKSKI